MGLIETMPSIWGSIHEFVFVLIVCNDNFLSPRFSWRMVRVLAQLLFCWIDETMRSSRRCFLELAVVSGECFMEKAEQINERLAFGAVPFVILSGYLIEPRLYV